MNKTHVHSSAAAEEFGHTKHTNHIQLRFMILVWVQE